MNADENSRPGVVMETHEVGWEHFLQVAAHPAARSFVERLEAKEKRPKTIDAYARAIEDLLDIL